MEVVQSMQGTVAVTIEGVRIASLGETQVNSEWGFLTVGVCVSELDLSVRLHHRLAAARTPVVRRTNNGHVAELREEATQLVRHQPQNALVP